MIWLRSNSPQYTFQNVYKQINIHLSRWKLSTYVGDAKDYTGIYSAWTHAHDHACSHVQVFKR